MKNKPYTSIQSGERMEISKTEYNELLQKSILLNNLLNSIPDFIYFKDKESRFIKISRSMVKLFKGADSPNDLIGKSDFDFQDKEAAQKYYDNEQQIMNTKTPLINDIQHEIFENGVEQWVSTTKMPLLDENGDAIGTFGISKDITDLKKMEHDLIEKNNIMLAQEEELRQNLEELQTTQEHLNKQVEENKIANEKLEFEKALLDNFLAYLPDHVYFKDKQCRFIRMSDSMVKLFKGAGSTEDLIGKSDFDFQDKEVAQKYYDNEQQIMKSKKPLINDIQHETFDSGVDQWVSTTKMPLLDKNGEAIGTFGISKDITEIKTMEQDLVEKNNIMLAQEEELRQNLEELQTTQEHLNMQIEENKRTNKKLEFEKALLDNFLAYLPDHVYFKDKQCRFIRMSDSMVKLFKGAGSTEDLIGKSDFDFQDKEVAQKYYDNEQQIMKSKKPLINDIQHEVFDSGIEQWVSTTKMPLLDKNGDAIGTFGISKDITKIKKLEQNLLEKNNTLEEAQVELEENIEELNIVNEALDRQTELTFASIKYAKSIQEAMLPFKVNMDKFFESFIIFKPRDIVSGDFYWYYPIVDEKDKKLSVLFIAVVDCTGHGVPGAFMSMIGNRLLNDIIVERKIYDPATVLVKMDEALKKALKQEQSENNDGMDICLCKVNILDKSSRKIVFSGAKRPLYIYQHNNHQVNILNGDRRSIGGYKIQGDTIDFTNKEIIIEKDDVIYLTTDGMIDQNNYKRKRYGSKNFIEMLKKIGNLSFIQQKKILTESLNKHQDNEKQRDDITIIGFKF